MPVKRRNGVSRRTLGVLEAEHCETGPDHLLADGPDYPCWICERGIEAARGLWEEHRADIVARWRYPFPMFAQIKLDGAPFHPLNVTRDGDRLIWRMIESALDDGDE